MKNVINEECHDLYVFACIGEKIFVNFIGYDLDKQVITNVVAPIHQQINAIYQNEITKDFIKRLEYKLKLTMRFKPAKITFVNEDGLWVLQTLFSDIYKPVILTHDGTKMEDNSFVMDGKVLRIFPFKGKILLECLIDEISIETNYFVPKIKTIIISDEINAIYNDNNLKDEIMKILNIKSKRKKVFLYALSKYLEGKILNVKYDEHNEYILWTLLYDFIVSNNDNK